MLITLIDFGLFILIWLTQLIVYPSFTYFSEKNLLKWHSKYTETIFFFVMPLMFTQIGLHLFALYQEPDWLKGISIILIGLAWINTFLFAVPLHRKIADGINATDAAKSLVRLNWYRTVFWSLVFGISLFSSLIDYGVFN